VVQYVPDLVRGELMNIGIFLHIPDEKYLGCLFTDDYRRIKRFHPRADLEFLRELQSDFEKQIEQSDDNLEKYIQSMQHSFSNLIQLAEPRFCLLAEPQSELGDLYAHYVGDRVSSAPLENTRLRVKQKLTAAFSLAGIWEKLEKRIPASTWTHPGDPFTFDYGYRPLLMDGKANGHLHFIHALSLKHDPELAKVLVYTLERVRRKEAAQLTAVVDALATRGDKRAGLSQRILEDGDIAIQPVVGINDFAQAIRQQLMI
jgi:hypothetical protein